MQCWFGPTACRLLQPQKRMLRAPIYGQGYTAADAHGPAKSPFCHACARLPFFLGRVVRQCSIFASAVARIINCSSIHKEMPGQTAASSPEAATRLLEKFDHDVSAHAVPTEAIIQAFLSCMLSSLLTHKSTHSVSAVRPPRLAQVRLAGPTHLSP